MRLDVKNSDQFQRMLSGLSDDLVYANIHFSLNQHLRDAVPDYIEVFNQSSAFWSLTVGAHMDACLVRLCRAYDTHVRSLNLRNLIDTIEGSLGWFDEPEFRERVKKNFHLESLAAVPRRPDAAQLAKDRAFVTAEGNPLVKTLIQWRHNAVAHQSVHHALNPAAFVSHNELLFSDIQLLAQEGMRILNSYSSLFQARTDMPRMIGDDDYKFVLDAVKEKLKAIRAAFDAEVRRFRTPSAS